MANAVKAVRRAPQLWLLRHARPLIDAGVCYGALNVAADTEHTRQSAAELAKRLPDQVAELRCSTLERCIQLTQALLHHRPHWQAQFDERLCEMNFQRWEGMNWDDVPRAELDAWNADFSGYAPGGGESLALMLKRVGQALQASCKAALEQDKDVVWVTHAGVIRCVQWLRDHGTRLPQAHEWTQRSPGFGGGLALPAADAGIGVGV